MSAMSNGLFYVVEILDDQPWFIYAFATAEQRQWYGNGYAEAASGTGWLATYPLVDEEWDSDHKALKAKTERFMVAHMAEEGTTLDAPQSSQ